ncbi:MAG: hypothetical protein ACW96U_00020 [Candidatus Heimdallarchaeaceae archaeon]|jgi:hypothetical protein
MILTSNAFGSKLNSTHRIIHTKIELYNTGMAVPTLGIPFEMYEWTDTSTPDWSGKSNLDRILPADSGDNYGVIPNFALSWSYASPFFMNVGRWAIEFTPCYFYAEQGSSNLRFYFMGSNVTVQMIWGASTEILADTELIHGTDYYANTSSQTVSSSTWYQFKIRLYGTTGFRRGGIACHYTYDSSPSTTDWRSNTMHLLNAGVSNYTNSFLSAINVPHHFNIQGEREENEPSKYTFSVPYGDVGGAYEKNSDNEYENGSTKLKEGKLIQIFAGYDCGTAPDSGQTVGDISGNIEYIPRFKGYIEGFSVNRKSNELQVTCRDFFMRAENQLCINYPDHVSYWTGRYVSSDIFDQPNGYAMPIAYDRWGVVDAVKDLFIKAGLPYSLFLGNEYRRQSDDDIVPTSNCVQDNEYRLDEARLYGTHAVKEYVHKFDVGTTLHEAIIKLADTYGYLIGFRYDGYLRFTPRNNPTDRENSDSPSSGTSTEVTDSKAVGGSYEQISSTNTITYSGLSGTGITVIVKRDTTSGASDNSNDYKSGTAQTTLVIKDSTPATVSTYNYNFYLDSDWYYIDGTHPSLGYNACVIPLDQDLDYDTYSLEITNISGTYQTKIDEIWVYNYNYSVPVKTLKTYRESNVIASINEIDFKRGIKDQRNDILVVGQRKGIWVPGGNREVGLNDPEFSEYHNNQFVNYHSRNVDIESIYNPEALNYIGMHLMTYIQEPNINTYHRARWLSSHVLNSYRGVKNEIDLSVIGDPEVDIADAIYVKDKLEESAVNEQWIKKIEESIEKNNWDVKLGITGQEPYPSYEENPEYNITLFNDEYIADLNVTDSYQTSTAPNGFDRSGSFQTTLTNDVTDSSIQLHVAANVYSLPSDEGVVVVYNQNETRYGVFHYTSRSGSILFGEWFYTTPIPGGGTVHFFSGWSVANIYNPYEQADTGIYLNISFRCLVEGRVSIGVKKESTEVLRYVAGVSSGGGLSDRGMPKEQAVYSGTLIDEIWGGVDEAGVTHDTPGDQVGRMFFASDGTYYFSINFTRSSDSNTRIYNTSSYVDENGIGQSKSMYLKRTAVDDHELSYSFADKTRYEGHYVQGGDGNYSHSARYDSINRDYIWVSTDGNIDVDLKSHNIDTNRLYFINYAVEHISGTVAKYVGMQWHADIFQSNIFDGELNEGEPVTWRYSSSYSFPFNPKWDRFGGIDFDQDFYNLVREYGGTDSGNAGKIYFIRLILDIRDMSGRRINVVTNRGDTKTALGEDGKTAENAVYKRDNGDTVLELMWIPYTIDISDTVGTINLANHYQLVQGNSGDSFVFQAKGSIPYTCFINRIWDQ